MSTLDLSGLRTAVDDALRQINALTAERDELKAQLKTRILVDGEAVLCWIAGYTGPDPTGFFERLLETLEQRIKSERGAK